jgi:hypothetical protein
MISFNELESNWDNSDILFTFSDNLLLLSYEIIGSRKKSKSVSKLFILICNNELFIFVQFPRKLQKCNSCSSFYGFIHG